MKKIIIITLTILNLLIYTPTIAQTKKLILNNMTIVIDPGHGGKDVGTSYKEIYEKDINLSLSLLLKEEFEKYGATIVMTRESDYDISTPNTKTRKRSDFNNRIRIINGTNPNLIISIHQNYFNDSKYKGTQIFYKGNEDIAEYLQQKINPKRKSKKISNDLYMFNKLKGDTLLIECGFLSNYEDRKNFTSKNYQKNYVKKLAEYIVEYYKNEKI